MGILRATLITLILAIYLAGISYRVEPKRMLAEISVEDIAMPMGPDADLSHIKVDTSGCEPTAQEAASAVCSTTPAAFIFSIFWLWILLLLWRRRYRELTIDWKRVLIIFAGTMVLAVAQIPFMFTTNVLDWMDIVIILYGTSFLSLTLISWRIWFMHKPEISFTFAVIPPLILSILPALPLLTGELENSFLEELATFVWALPGYSGLVTGPILAGLLIEAIVRGRKKGNARNLIARRALNSGNSKDNNHSP